MYKSALLFGPPGSGKGLQGTILNNIPGIFHCAMGDVFRSLDKTSDLGKIFVEHSTSGKLVPDEITIKIWEKHIENKIKEGKYNPQKDLLLLDGIPRTADQANAMAKHINVLKIIHLNCPDKNILIKRINNRAKLENRKDDTNENIILHRLEVYEKETLGVLSNYSPEVIVNIDAFLPPIEVLSQIVQSLAEITGK